MVNKSPVSRAANEKALCKSLKWFQRKKNIHNHIFSSEPHMAILLVRRDIQQLTLEYATLTLMTFTFNAW